MAILDGQVLPSIRIESNEVFTIIRPNTFQMRPSIYVPAISQPARDTSYSQLCMQAFNTVGCRGWGRVDLMVDSKGKFQLLEVNTSPG